MNRIRQKLINLINHQVRHQNVDHRSNRFGLLTILAIALGLWLTAATPSQAHWADMAAAEVLVGATDVQLTLTLPTGLVAFADSDQDGNLSSAEIHQHTPELQQFLAGQIYLSDRQNHRASLVVEPVNPGAAPIVPTPLPTSVQIAPKSHSSLRLTYSWSQAIAGFSLHYGLFLPGVNTAHCLATILQNGQLQTFMFTPNRQVFSLMPNLGLGGLGSGLWAILGAFAWGAMHSLSPGHGKTLVGAYLMGERATPKHAFFLAATTTITHTLGVFALGGMALFASQYILPQQLYPWLSLLSGVMVVGIGLHLLNTRLRYRKIHHSDHSHHHSDHSHYHSDHSHHHHASHVHDQGHSHSAHHAHRPSVTANPWQGLLALGISGGIMPCPAALVLLLGAISLNQVSLGLGLVLAFSLGLAGVLTALGLGMVYAKRLFVHLPTAPRFTRTLPAVSALCITLIGLGVSVQAVMQVVGMSPE